MKNRRQAAHIAHGAQLMTLAGALVLLLTACAACAAPRPSMKIALVAPFEGRWRDVGYQAFPALRMALREEIDAGGIGPYQIEFVAYNDNGDPDMAARVARNVALDDHVLAVIGHYRLGTTVAAAGVYTNAGLPVLAPGVSSDLLPADPLVFRMGPGEPARESALRQVAAMAECRATPALAALTVDALRTVPDLLSPAIPRMYGARLAGLCFTTDAPWPADLPGAQQTLADFPNVSGGFAPGPRSISTYDATRLLLEAIRLDVAEHGRPTRAGVADTLRRLSFSGLLGNLAFDSRQAWAEAPVWVYQFDPSGTARLLR